MEDDNDSYYRINNKRRRMFLYGSFLLCLLGAALVGAGMGTQFWVQAELTNYADVSWTGDFNAGLFQGESLQAGLNPSTFIYYTVCLEGSCMYSCAATKKDREAHLTAILDGREPGSCVEPDKKSARSSFVVSHVNSYSQQTKFEVPVGQKAAHKSPPLSLWNDMLQFSSRDQPRVLGNQEYFRESAVDVTTEDSDVSTDGTTDSPEITSTGGLMQQGLWAGTIACLSVGLLFAVLGAVFAVINTATTPVEAITGITGLYIWNSLAAFFELVAVILWAVQFTTHLSSNVLIDDSEGGWTTEGNEVLGYSFWLVVVSIVLHLANCALIGFGTYEPKMKEKIQEPDKATNDILLY